MKLTNLSIECVGPYVVNGVPLRRVNQKYVIATKTSVDVSAVNVASVDDALFVREKVAKKSGEEALFDSNAEPVKNTLSPERQAIQASIDALLVKSIERVELLSAYLKSKFTLTKSDKPHALVF